MQSKKLFKFQVVRFNHKHPYSVDYTNDSEY